jgi:hypothetical protein
MAHNKSTARLVGAPTGSGGKGHDSEGSTERTESVQLSDAGSHSGAGDEVDKGSCTQSYFFRLSTVAVSRIHGMINRGYFAEGMAHELGEETIPEPNSDKAVFYEEFFSASLRMPSHPVLADILLKLQLQIHQLTPNVIVQLSKYIWAVTSFEGVRSAQGFAKRYELHYQPMKMEVDRVEVQGQYRCISFHVKRGSQRVKLTIAIKNRWSGACTQAWFYCKVPLLWILSPERSKGIFALHSYMTALEFATDPPFECPDDDAGDLAFNKATRSIGG